MQTWNVFGLQHMIRIGRNKEKKKKKKKKKKISFICFRVVNSLNSFCYSLF